MKKRAKPQRKTTNSRGEKRSTRLRGETSKPAKPTLIRTEWGEDERGIPYRKDIYRGNTSTTFGKTLPPPLSTLATDASPEEVKRHAAEVIRYNKAKSDALDFAAKCCHLIRSQRKGQRAKWMLRGPDTTVLRGEIARTTLQRRWDDAETMAIVRAMESVHNQPDRAGCLDGNSLRSAVLNPRQRAKLGAAIKVVETGGLLREVEPPRPLRIGRAVVAAAQILDRPPTAREAFEQYVILERAEGRIVWREQDPTPKKGEAEKGSRQRDLWKTKAQTNWYRDLERAGWGWLVG